MGLSEKDLVEVMGLFFVLFVFPDTVERAVDFPKAVELAHFFVSFSLYLF